jgi:hydrogenase-1 operon protein HyaF
VDDEVRRRQRPFPFAVVVESGAAPEAGACGSSPENSTPAPLGTRVATGNVPLLLTEIAHALERLADSGATHTIDLRAIPLGPGEEDRLLAFLGHGELQAQFESLGRSEIRECAFPGLWCVTHENPGGHVTGRFLEISYVPDLLAAAPAEVRVGLDRLRAELAAEA